MDEKEGKGVPFVKGSETSAAAAESMVDHSTNIELQVLSYFMHMAAYSGATDDEIEQHLGLKHQTASARRRQLERRGMVVKMYEGGKRVRRPTRSGRLAGVYISRRLYDTCNDPTVNPPVFYDQATYELVEQLKFFGRFIQSHISDLDGSDGEIKNGCQHVENMVNKLSCITEDVKSKARRVWVEQRQREDFPQ
jgi:hypothetical protein